MRLLPLSVEKTLSCLFEKFVSVGLTCLPLGDSCHVPGSVQLVRSPAVWAVTLQAEVTWSNDTKALRTDRAVTMSHNVLSITCVNMVRRTESCMSICAMCSDSHEACDDRQLQLVATSDVLTHIV